MAAWAEEIAGGSEHLRFEALGPEEIDARRDGCARGRQPGEPQPAPADHARLRAAGPAPTEVRLGLVGKAITFDAGGLSLKPAYRMDEMKSDMGGGGAVLAASVRSPSSASRCASSR